MNSSNVLKQSVANLYTSDTEKLLSSVSGHLTGR